MSSKDEYQKYLETEKWKTIRAQRLAMDNNECVLCGENAEHVHHRRYTNEWGTETVSDLVSLCSGCHKKHHGDTNDCDEKKAIELMSSYEGLLPVVEESMQLVRDGAETKSDLNGDEMLEIISRFSLLLEVISGSICEQTVPGMHVVANRIMDTHFFEEHAK